VKTLCRNRVDGWGSSSMVVHVERQVGERSSLFASRYSPGSRPDELARHKLARLSRALRGLVVDLETSRDSPRNYGKLYRADQQISTGWVESTANEIMAKRLVGKEQMRWNRFTVQVFLTVRSACAECHAATSLQHVAHRLPVACCSLTTRHLFIVSS
jgi:hypothetical protein